jgi:Zn-dependent protease/CBS domain-containing protein
MVAAPPEPRPAATGGAAQSEHRSDALPGTVRIGRLAGIPVGVQPLWLVVVGLVTWSLGAEYFPSEAPGIGSVAAYGLGLASALLIFAGILAHEFGHAIVARRNGVRIEEIDLWLLGGVARMRDEPPSAGAELRFALAGPLVTALLVALLATVRLVLPGGAADWLRAFVDYQLYVNGAILALNLLPAFPLDGGRVLRALLWRQGQDQLRATLRAAAVGRAFGWGFVVLGLLAFVNGAPDGLWFMLIGGFLILASRAEADALRRSRLLAGWSAADAMTVPVVTLRADATVAEAIALGVARHLHRAYPAVDELDRPLGLVTVRAMRTVGGDDRGRVAIGEILDADPDLIAPLAEPLADTMRRPAVVRTGRAIVVDADGRVAGIISATDVERLLMVRDLVAPGRPT